MTRLSHCAPVPFHNTGKVQPVQLPSHCCPAAQASQTAWGRPVDVMQDHLGALMISDDSLGTVYRVVYKASSKRSRASRAARSK